MKVYGVEHGQFLEFAGIHAQIEDAGPSDEMLDDLRRLPPGTKVGVEAAPEILDGRDLGLISFKHDGNAYWKPIVEACSSADLDVVFLDDVEHYKKIARFSIAARGLLSTVEGHEEEYTADSVQNARELAFTLHTHSEHAFEVEREKAIFHRMEEQKPEVAIIGKAHGDYLALKPDEAKIAVDEYIQTMQSDNDGFHLSDFMDPSFTPSTGPQQLAPFAEPNPQFLLDREAILRKYRAVTEGRITEGGEPAFIGSWTPRCRQDGLFEVHPDSLTSGIIEDSLGTALYEGTMRNDHTHFDKRYTVPLTDDAVRDPLRYVTERVNGDITEGMFGIQDLGQFLPYGAFVLKAGAVLYEPVDLESEDMQELIESINDHYEAKL